MSRCIVRTPARTPDSGVPIPPSENDTELDISGVVRIADGKIAELWITWDNLAVLTQLGHWPPPPGNAGV